MQTITQGNDLKASSDDLETSIKVLSIRHDALLRLVFSAMTYEEFRSRCMIYHLQRQNGSIYREIGHLTRLKELLSSECKSIVDVNRSMQQECETLKSEIIQSIGMDMKEITQVCCALLPWK